jgi:hypothetical protein
MKMVANGHQELVLMQGALEGNLGVQNVEAENLLAQSVDVKEDAKEKVRNLLDVNLLS